MNKNYFELGKNRSAIRELFEIGKVLKKELGEDSVFDYSIGNPSVATPKEVNEKISSLIKNKDSLSLHSYTSAAGDLNSRKAIKDFLNKKYCAEVDEKYIYLTSGAASAICIALHSIAESKDDEIIVFAPYFPEYSVFISSSGAKMVSVLPREDFLVDLEDFENKISPHTKAVIINSPNNPTGVFYDEELIKKITEILLKKEKEYQHPIYLLSDEPYRELLFSDKKYPFITNYYDDSLVAYSFSKVLSLPGERVGYLLVNPKAKDAEKLFFAISGAARSLGYICMTSLFQYLIPEILEYQSDISVYRNNRDYLYRELKRIGYEAIYPEGAFYLFVKSLEDDADEFSKKGQKYHLLMPSSNTFGYPGYVRLSIAVSHQMIENSIPAFQKLYEEYRGKH